VATLTRLILLAGSLAMALAVAAGAYASHAARSAAHPEAPRLLQTAVLFMLVHGLGILAAGILARPVASPWLVASAALHVAGIVLFCGSLWILAMSGRSLGVAPFGGLCFIAGWLALAGYALQA
jgi:uncharacterized membrane protein YgdD (TMEM256/DUF423 family)